MRRNIPIGLLYSTTGTYGTLGHDCHDGAMMSVQDVNANDAYDFRFTPQVGNPGGDIYEYHRLSETMLRDGKCRNIIGTITSLSRKETIPIIEKHDGLLWYMTPYEGFECCENVIYTGACPNQHIVPMFAHLIPHYGRRAYLVGSNYVWGWEINRVGRELISSCGGEITGEKYLPFGSVDVHRMIKDIKETRPNFILNNLIGASSYAFFRAYYAAGKTDDFFQPENCPIVSCNLTECELQNIGYDAAVGHLSASPYFESVKTAGNGDFIAAAQSRFGKQRPISSFFVNAYQSVRYLADAIQAGGSDEIEVVKNSLFSRKFTSPLGLTRISAKTNHAALPFYLGRIRPERGFELVLSHPDAIEADPYLVGFDAKEFAAQATGARTRQSHLQVVR